MTDNVTQIGAYLNTAPPRKKRGGSWLPDDCPVQPLGGDGRNFYYLNAIGQLVVIPAQQHSRNQIAALFAPDTAWLVEHFPKKIDDDTGMKSGFRPEAVAEALMNASQFARVAWEPGENVRGRGAWPGEDNDLVVHLGSDILAGGKLQKPGKRGNLVYPVRPQRPGPVQDRQGDANAGGPAAELLALLECWNWRHGTLGARLMLGWIVGGFLCGALPWRPHLWLVAPRGSGKSTLLELLGHILARGEGFHLLEDATPAAVRTIQGYDALPVALDEMEPSEDNTKLDRMLELLRPASKGGTVARGTAEHQAVQQTVRFMAICASIVRPSMMNQDASRITLLELAKPKLDAVAPLLNPGVLRLLGQRLFRRAIDTWPRFHETRQRWGEELAKHRVDQRVRDQIGTLLTLQWMALHDLEPDSDSLEEMATAVAEITKPERAEDRQEWFRCIERLAATIIPSATGQQKLTVAELLETASYRRKVKNENGEEVMVSKELADAAQSALARVGLRFEPLRDENKLVLRQSWYHLERDIPHDPSASNSGPMAGYLAVANSSPELAKLFERTRWAARSGAAGAWKGVLEAAPGAVVPKDAVRFGPRTSRCVKVPIELVFDGAGEGDAE